MSQSALMRGVRDRLRTVLSLGQDECDVQRGPRPTPRAGPVFLSVHPGEWRSHRDFVPGGSYYSDHVHGVRITISLKTAQIPRDRWGEEFAAAAQDAILALEWLSEQVCLAVEGNIALINAANAYITGDASKFVSGELLTFVFGTVPEDQMPEWWGAVVPPNITPQPQGLSRTMTFFGARRIRAIAELGSEWEEDP
ncbi:MAG: hypothetical protein IT428_19845 [Planctomycetaceae bacterium]|nr:hypothetical protein [Planctomycetaceae bacterium]